MRNLCKYLLRPLIGIRTMTAYAHAVCGWTSPSPSQNTSFSLQPQYHHLAPSSKDQMLQRCLVCDALPHCIILLEVRKTWLKPPVVLKTTFNLQNDRSVTPSAGVTAALHPVTDR